MSEKARKPVPSKPDHSRASDSHTADMVDHYWGSLTYIQSLIKASELKAGLILSFYGILLNFVYQSFRTFLPDGSSSIVVMILMALWFLSTAFSINYCIRCFIPRIEGSFDDNVFFFKDIITKFGDIKEFSRTFYHLSLDEERVFGQMGEQIFIVSKIAAWKFRNVQRAIRFLAAGLMILLVMIACVVFFG